METSKTIKLSRIRNYPYIVNFNSSEGFKKTYEWSGSKDNKIDTKSIPEEVVQYLMMNTTTFTDGELKIVEDEDNTEAKEAIDNLNEEYKNNSHTKDEITKLLEGNFMKMKSEINKITNKQELNFIVDVAKEIKLDSNSKLAFLATTLNVPQDILFETDEV